MMGHRRGGLSRPARERISHHAPRILAFVARPNLLHGNQGETGFDGCDWHGWGFHRETADLHREDER
jgi:hypothetical protein